MKILISGLCAFFLLTSLSDWKTRYDKDGVIVKVRSEGSSRDIYATVEVNASIDKCLKVLRDMEKLKKFSYRSNIVRLVSQPSANEWIVYFTYNMPPLIKNRDAVVHYSLKHFPDGNIEVAYKPVSSVVPESDDYKRQDEFAGVWRFEKISPLRTKVIATSQNGIDGFPGWLVNMVITSAPKHTMIYFREEVEK